MTETQEELEVIPATRSPHGYLASFLSDNIAEKDDGTLIVVGCPIARTGWQKYSVKDLPQKHAEDLGVDVSNPEASIDLYRPADEVFHPEFLASLNGVVITDGHPPNGEFVDPKNFSKYSMGHIQNVRKGAEPMEDGEWPIIADLHISAEPLISKVRNKIAREISLGYDFSIKRVGDKICQCSMVGNHNAVVPKGRAGDLVRIEDAAPDANQEASLALPPSPSLPTEVQPAPVAEVIEPTAYPPIVISFKSNKEKQPVAQKKSWLRSLMGKHLIEMARATDADPEEILEAAREMHDDADTPKNTQSNEFKSEDKKAKDGELPEALKKNEFKKSEDRHKAKDDDDDNEEDEEPVDDRKKAHDALDRILDKRKGRDRKRAKDANIEALKTLLDEFLSEEEKEPEHAEDVEAEVDLSELENMLGEECPECGEFGDDCECVESGEEVLDEDDDVDKDMPEYARLDTPKEDLTPEHNVVKGEESVMEKARAADGAMATLRALRPVVARTGDKAVRAAFNRALDSVKKSSRASSGGYGEFASSARARDRAPRNPNPERRRAGDSVGADPVAKMQQFYDNAHKGGK